MNNIVHQTADGRLIRKEGPFRFSVYDYKDKFIIAKRSLNEAILAMPKKTGIRKISESEITRDELEKYLGIDGAAQAWVSNAPLSTVISKKDKKKYDIIRINGKIVKIELSENILSESEITFSEPVSDSSTNITIYVDDVPVATAQRAHISDKNTDEWTLYKTDGTKIKGVNPVNNKAAENVFKTIVKNRGL